MALKVVKKNNVLWVTGRLFGQQVRKSTRLPVGYEREAEKIRMELEADIVEGNFGDKAKTKTFHDACENYLRWKMTEGNLSSDTERKVDRFRKLFGDYKIADITTGMISDVCLDEFAGLKAGSLRRYLNILSAILRHAERTWDMRAPSIIRPHVDDARDEHFTIDQANTFLAWVEETHPYYAPHFTILIDCGVRLNEMLRMTAGDFEGEWVMVRRPSANRKKTKMRRVPMSEGIKKIRGLLAVEGCAVRKPSGEAFPDSNTASSYLGKVLRQGCDALGYPRLRVHDLRHTFAFLCSQAGADLGDLQILLGHDDISQTMRYRGFIPSRAKSAIAVMRDTSGK